MKESKQQQANLTRRQALKTLAGITGAAALSMLPKQWETPVVEVGALPAHARISPPQNMQPIEE